MRGRTGKGLSNGPQSSGDWKVVLRLLPYLWDFRGRVAIALSLLALAKGANVLLPVVLKYLVDGLDALKAQDNLAVLPLALLLAYGACRLGTVVFAELRDLVFGRVGERAMRRIAVSVFDHLHKLDLSFHLERRTGGLSRDIERGQAGISFLLRFLLFNILPTLLEITLIAVILMAAYDYLYAVITFISVICYIALSVLMTEWRTRFVRQANELDSAANTRAVDSLLNFETVKYFNNERWEAEEYDESLARWEQAAQKNRFSLAGLNIGQAIVIATALMAMLTLAAQGVISGEMTLGDFVLVNAYMIQLFVPLNFLGFVYREIRRALADMSRMFSLLDVSPAVVDVPNAPRLAINHAEIEFSHISFGYDESRQILNDVSFSVPAGSSVALVGASGSGKSTIARLLFRFYDPDSGTIKVDGQAINQVQQLSLRQNIGIVPQDTVLLNQSIGYNIRYGRPTATDQEVAEAVRLAHLEAFIARLPEGLETRVGERGLKLSGGEKQRVAIARALLKNPPILIFDEATSSLDSVAERSILDAMNELARNRTTLVIAHRLSTIAHVDQILVLDQGRVVERGRHESLLQSQGVYAGLWAAQKTSN